MATKFIFQVDTMAEVWTARSAQGAFNVAMSLSDRIEAVSCQMTPDEALDLAAALERAAFIQRRAASIGTERAEAEAAFVALRTAQARREVAKG